MKANLTRGNIITENHNPYETMEQCFSVAFAVVADVLDKYRKSIPVPNYIKGTNSVPGGMAIVGERGPELILPKGTDIMPHKETLKYLKSNPITKFEHGTSRTKRSSD